jgi:hypothetical protein
VTRATVARVVIAVFIVTNLKPAGGCPSEWPNNTLSHFVHSPVLFLSEGNMVSLTKCHISEESTHHHHHHHQHQQQQHFMDWANHLFYPLTSNPFTLKLISRKNFSLAMLEGMHRASAVVELPSLCF